MRNENNRNWMVMSVCALVMSVIGLSIAYAAMSETLKVTGTAEVKASTWDIHFANVTATKVGEATYTLPTLADTTLSDYTVTLTKPGDAVTFNFDVVNGGTLNAVLGTLTQTAPQCTGTGATATDDASTVCGNLRYSLKYADNTDVAETDALAKDSTKSMKLTLEYDANASALPNADVTVEGLDVTMIYNQN